MDMRVDPKGKYFTPRVTKDSLLAVIRTAQEIIVGSVYVRPDKRLKDEINDDTSRFLPITDARVYTLHNEYSYDVSFTLISYTAILSITPVDAITSNADLPWLTSTPQEETNS